MITIGIYDNREEPAYRGTWWKSSDCDNPYILQWWTPAHDELLARHIDEKGVALVLEYYRQDTRHCTLGKSHRPSDGRERLYEVRWGPRGKARPNKGDQET